MHVKLAFWVVLLNRTIAQGEILELFYVNVFEFLKKLDFL